LGKKIQANDREENDDAFHNRPECVPVPREGQVPPCPIIQTLRTQKPQR
jgi:hypothetical protein